jgi:hypothetical protein
MYKLIESHGEKLKLVFRLGLDEDGYPDFMELQPEPVALCKELFRLEHKAHRLSTDYCNGDIHHETWEHKTDLILEKVDKILHFYKQEIPVFVNPDCRGYALKIGDEYIKENQIKIYRDWGGYGIIAPDYKHEAESQLKYKHGFAAKL